MLADDAKDARAECDHLAEAIQRGGPLDVLVDRLRGAEARRLDLEARMAAAHEIVAPPVGPGLEQRLRTKLADWRGLLRRNVDCGREVLRALLVVPLRFTPITEGRRRAYKFEGLVGLSRLVAGVIELPTLTGVASPSGTALDYSRDFQGIWRSDRRAA